MTKATQNINEFIDIEGSDELNISKQLTQGQFKIVSYLLTN
jgi:hypothetical protein